MGGWVGYIAYSCHGNPVTYLVNAGVKGKRDEAFQEPQQVCFFLNTEKDVSDRFTGCHS